MKMYISGAITGRPKEEYLKQFADAEQELKEAGYEVINPAQILNPLPESTTHGEYMEICMALLKQCDAICVLEGWLDSTGAQEEFLYATKNNYCVFVELNLNQNRPKNIAPINAEKWMCISSGRNATSIIVEGTVQGAKIK